MINNATILFFLFFVFISSSFAYNKNIEKLIDSYANVEGFSSVKIKEPAKTLPNMNKQQSNALKDLLEGVDMIRVLKMDKNKASKEINEKFSNEVNSFKPGDGFKELLSVKEAGTFVKMHIKESATKDVTDLLMIAGENSQITLIWFNGKLDLEKIQKSASLLPKLLK